MSIAYCDNSEFKCIHLYVLLTALYVSVDRRITLKSLKAKLEPYVGTSVDNFKVIYIYIFIHLCCISFCMSMLLLFFLLWCIRKSVSFHCSITNSLLYSTMTQCFWSFSACSASLSVFSCIFLSFSVFLTVAVFVLTDLVHHSVLIVLISI